MNIKTFVFRLRQLTRVTNGELSVMTGFTLGYFQRSLAGVPSERFVELLRQAMKDLGQPELAAELQAWWIDFCKRVIIPSQASRKLAGGRRSGTATDVRALARHDPEKRLDWAMKNLLYAHFAPKDHDCFTKFFDPLDPENTDWQEIIKANHYAWIAHYKAGGTIANFKIPFDADNLPPALRKDQ